MPLSACAALGLARGLHRNGTDALALAQGVLERANTLAKPLD
jgi:hypothetical protein